MPIKMKDIGWSQQRNEITIENFKLWAKVEKICNSRWIPLIKVLIS